MPHLRADVRLILASSSAAMASSRVTLGILYCQLVRFPELSGTEATRAGFEDLLGPRHAPSGFASSVSIEAEILSVTIGLVRGA